MTDRTYTHLLVPTDFRPECRAAYRLALAAAAGTGARVTLLHVAPKPTLDLSEDEYRGLDAIRLIHRAAERWAVRERTAESITAEDAEMVARLQAEVPPGSHGSQDLRFAVRRGAVTEEIVRFAREEGVDLIVTASNPAGFRAPFTTTRADQLAKKLPQMEILRVTTAARADDPQGAPTGG